MTIFRAKIDQFEIDVDKTEDYYPNSIVVNEFPFVDGGSAEHLGDNSAETVLTTYWMNGRYNLHQAFLDHIRSKRTLFEFRHPKYGIRFGRIRSPRVVHPAGTSEYCKISFSFVEELLTKEIPVRVALGGVMESSWLLLQDGARSFAFDRIIESLPEAKGLLNYSFNSSLSIMTQVGKITGASRRFLRQLDQGLNIIDGALAAVELPADALTNLVDYGTTLPGRVVNSVANTVERYVVAAQTTSQFPTRVVSSVKSSLTALKSELKTLSSTEVFALYEDLLNTIGAQTTAVYLSRMYEADDEKREQYEFLLDQESWDDSGNRIADIPRIDVYTLPELEASLYMIREYLQQTMNLDRENLKEHRSMAMALEQHVRTIKEGRDNVVEIDLGDSEIPLHLLCGSRDLPYRYADMIMAINPKIENPTFISGKVKLYER